MRFTSILSLPSTVLADLQDKQLNINIKHLGKLAVAVQLLMFVTVTVNPYSALAFESSLSTSHTNPLVAPVDIVRGDEVTLTQPSEPAGYLKQSVIADQNPVTVPVSADTRLAYAPSVSRSPLPTSGASPVLKVEGQASFYSRNGCLGCSENLTMANGQPLDDEALTMAIGADKKHLVGHTAVVTNLATDQSVEVLITDTGGFYQEKYGNRVADLTIATKSAIGMSGGVGQVRVEVR